MEDILINGGLAMLILEGVKFLLRRFIFKNPAYDFPQAFYLIAIPVLNVLCVPLLVLMGVTGVSMPTDWIGWIRSAVLILVSSLVSVLFYSQGVKKLKEYGIQQKAGG